MAKNKPLIITIVAGVVLAFLVAATSASAPAGLRSGATAVGGIFVPLETFFYGISDNIRQSAQPAAQDTGADETAAAYRVMLMDYNEIKAENQRLKTLLEYKDNQPEKDLVTARVIGKEPGNWFEVFTIDVGANNGVQEDMAVVTPDGLAGRVEQVGPNWAKVMSVIDSRSRVPVIVERTRDVGVAGGPLGGDSVKELSMNYLPLDSDITAGDVVVTSGLGDLFPRGIPVGTVAAAKQDPKDTEISITPLVNFKSIYEVFVITEARETAAVVNDDITDHNAVIITSQSQPPTEPDTAPTQNGANTQSAPQDGAAPTAAPEDGAAPQTAAPDDTPTDTITPEDGIPAPVTPNDAPPQVIPPGNTDTEIVTPGAGNT